MTWLALFSRFKTERLVEQLAGQIATLSHAAVRQRLSAQVASMSRAETRGYVRARAAAVVRHEVALLLATQPQVPRTAHGELMGRATNQLVQRLTHELFYDPPMPVPVRRAA